MIAKHCHIVQFKANDIIARQDEVQERALFLLAGEVFMIRRVKDVHEQSLITQNPRRASGSNNNSSFKTARPSTMWEFPSTVGEQRIPPAL